MDAIGLLAERSGIRMIKAVLTALVGEGDDEKEVALCTVSAFPGTSKNSGKVNFNSSQRVPCPTLKGQRAGTAFQLGLNFTAIHSQKWTPITRVVSSRSEAAKKAAATRAANKAARAAAAS